jgi:hypothetical protein
VRGAIVVPRSRSGSRLAVFPINYERRTIVKESLTTVENKPAKPEERGAIGAALVVWLLGGSLGLAVIVFILAKLF